VPTYGYEFNDSSAPELLLPPVSFPYGAAHASELQYLFDLPPSPFGGPLSPQQEQLAAAMQRYWTNLAKRGAPSGFLTPPAQRWPRFSPASQQLLSLDTPQPQVETGFAADHHCAFWALAG
jgi:para-nitrobenzyl esterase